MASEIKMSFHKRLFLMLLTFSWAIVLCFIGYQYLREKEYKLEFLNVQLQQYNHHLLETIEDGLSYEDFITTHDKPFDELRISIVTLLGTVVYDNTISLDSLDNHRNRPEVIDALAKGEVKEFLFMEFTLLSCALFILLFSFSHLSISRMEL